MEIPKDNCNFAATKEYYMVSINDRSKNREALLELDISPLQREVIVKSLQVQDYVEGPVIGVSV